MTPHPSRQAGTESAVLLIVHHFQNQRTQKIVETAINLKVGSCLSSQFNDAPVVDAAAVRGTRHSESCAEICSR